MSEEGTMDRQGHTDVLARVSKRQRAIVEQREYCVRAWRWALIFGKRLGLRQADVTPHFRAFCKSIGFEVSPATLAGWERELTHGGQLALADQRGMRGRLKRYGPFFLELERVFSGRIMPMDIAHQLAAQTARANAWPIPALRDSRRYLKRYILPGLTAERGARSNGQ
jgi:hypothetical protein